MKALWLVSILIQGCAVVDTAEVSKMRAEHAEMVRQLERQQAWNGGCSDDNSALQSQVIHLERLIRSSEDLFMELAEECAAVRRSCDM